MYEQTFQKIQNIFLIFLALKKAEMAAEMRFKKVDVHF